MTAVVAAAKSRGIGCEGGMVGRAMLFVISVSSNLLLTPNADAVLQPWNLPGDMKHFKEVTMGSGDSTNAVIMGRKTWESIPPRFRPLQGRRNIVLTRQTNIEVPDDVVVAASLDQAAECSADCDRVFVIGGAQIYQQAIDEGFVNSVVFTEVANLPDDTKFDAFFPELKDSEWVCEEFGGANKENSSTHVDAKSGIHFRFLQYDRIRNPEEQQYLDLCQEILDHGIRRGDRTGTGTLSKFGTQMRFSLRDDTLPLLTTKRTFWRGVAEELLWFIEVRYMNCAGAVFSLTRVSIIRGIQTPMT